MWCSGHDGYCVQFHYSWHHETIFSQAKFMKYHREIPANHPFYLVSILHQISRLVTNILKNNDYIGCVLRLWITWKYHFIWKSRNLKHMDFRIWSLRKLILCYFIGKIQYQEYYYQIINSESRCSGQTTGFSLG